MTIRSYRGLHDKISVPWAEVLVSTSVDHFQFDCYPLPPHKAQKVTSWWGGFNAAAGLARMSNNYCRHMKLRVQSL